MHALQRDKGVADAVRGIKALAPILRPGAFKKVFGEVDTDDNHELDLEEFSAFVQKAAAEAAVEAAEAKASYQAAWAELHADSDDDDGEDEEEQQEGEEEEEEDGDDDDDDDDYGASDEGDGGPRRADAFMKRLERDGMPHGEKLLARRAREARERAAAEAEQNAKLKARQAANRKRLKLLRQKREEKEAVKAKKAKAKREEEAEKRRRKRAREKKRQARAKEKVAAFYKAKSEEDARRSEAELAAGKTARKKAEKQRAREKKRAAAYAKRRKAREQAEKGSAAAKQQARERAARDSDRARVKKVKRVRRKSQSVARGTYDAEAAAARAKAKSAALTPRRLRKLFDQIDADRSGGLSRKEFMRALQRDKGVADTVRSIPALAPITQPSRMKEVFASVDANGDTALSFEEFSAFCAHAAHGDVVVVANESKTGDAKETEESKQAATKKETKSPAGPDTRKSTKSPEPVAPFAPKSGFEFTPKELKALFVKIDKDVSGSISRDEFKDALDNDQEVRRMVGKIRNLAPLLKDDSSFDKIFDAIDVDNNAELDFSEFSKFCAQASRQSTIDRASWQKKVPATRPISPH